MRSLLAVDVGAGTQDVLIYEPGKTLENCAQLILPSATVVVARKIEAATRLGRAVFLTGTMMGGGAVAGAVNRHLKAGLPVYAQPGPARTLNNDLDRVMAMGVQLCEEAPPEAVQIVLGDLDLPSLRRVLEMFEVPWPDGVAVAVQDHGHKPGMGNREFRFSFWQGFVESGGDIGKLLYRSPVGAGPGAGGPATVGPAAVGPLIVQAPGSAEGPTRRPPAEFTRMASVGSICPGAYLMDTAAAAVWGALEDPRVKERSGDGLTLVNIGNGHTFGVLIRDRRVWGLFEHHTKMVDSRKLASLVAGLEAGILTFEAVYGDGGHGAFIHPEYRGLKPFRWVAVTGPNRGKAESLGWYEAAPYGDMMLCGSFGLVAAVRDSLAT